MAESKIRQACKEHPYQWMQDARKDLESAVRIPDGWVFSATVTPGMYADQARVAFQVDDTAGIAFGPYRFEIIKGQDISVFADAINRAVAEHAPA